MRPSPKGSPQGQVRSVMQEAPSGHALVPQGWDLDVARAEAVDRWTLPGWPSRPFRTHRAQGFRLPGYNVPARTAIHDWQRIPDGDPYGL